MDNEVVKKNFKNRIEMLAKKIDIGKLIDEKIIEKVGEDEYKILDFNRLPKRMIKKIKKVKVDDEVIVVFSKPENIYKIIE